MKSLFLGALMTLFATSSFAGTRSGFLCDDSQYDIQKEINTIQVGQIVENWDVKGRPSIVTKLTLSAPAVSTFRYKNEYGREETGAFYCVSYSTETKVCELIDGKPACK